MRLVCVFHGEKVEASTLDREKFSIKTRVNTTLTPEGMEKILTLVPTLRELGPYESMYCSRLARALDTASVLAIELDLDFLTLMSLGQHASNDGKETIFYPGSEGECFTTWQSDAITALDEIQEMTGEGDHTVLIVSHRPIIGGLIALARDTHDAAGIEAVVRDPSITAKGFIVFELKGNKLTIID